MQMDLQSTHSSERLDLSAQEETMDTMSKVEQPLDNRDAPASSFQRSSSTEGVDYQLNHHGMSTKPRPPPMYHGLPSRGGYTYHGSQYHQYHRPSAKSQHPIQSVVTTSFEERDDGSGRLHRHFPLPDYRMEAYHFEGRSPLHGSESKHHAFEQPISDREQSYYGKDLTPIQEDGIDMRNPPHEVIVSRSMRVPPSPREQPPPLHRSLTDGSHLSPYPSGGPMKRNFWHHAKSGDEYHNSLPNEFMPPKRSKIAKNGRRDYVVTARSTSEENMQPPESIDRSIASPQGGWNNRAMSWEARDEYYHRKSGSGEIFSSGSWAKSPSYRESGIAPHWADAPSMPSPRIRYSPGEGGRYDISGHSWSPRWHSQSEPRWGGLQHRDDAESMHFSPSQEREQYGHLKRQGTFESRSDNEPPMRFINGPPIPTPGATEFLPAPLSHRVMSPPKSTETGFGSDLIYNNQNFDKKNGSIRVLALPEDRISLSETLCLVRENIEVFTATVEDVEAPAPGRKHAVVVGQVGLRCVHCRHCTRSSERVKRAVCYPSSIKRIYRTVIDMKLDHFSQCKFVPKILKDTLNALKANNTRSTGTTMQYFIRGAASLGMLDCRPSGVRLTNNVSEISPMISGSPTMRGLKPDVLSSSVIASTNTKTKEKTASPSIERNSSNSFEGSFGSSSSVLDEINMPKETFTGKIALSLPEDKISLSPLRCFLREQVCAFSATEEDIAVRTPTTYAVSVGQVGIACVHCLKQPAKSRSNRAVCFPFSIGRIYQSVADIQRFHIGECKMVPPDVKSKFVELQSASSKGSKGLATRQYWVTSAKKIGLVDTVKGIHFGRDPSQPESKAVSLDILAQVASHVTTVNRPLVFPEDKPNIADFLYVVMEQLQPCRFTEADRNKRRLKDVGCIGVECKHCAGKVDSRKFFWSSVNAVESNFVSVHTHMMECKYIPKELKDNLSELKKVRKEQTNSLKTGSQKAFFSRVWERLHGDNQEQRAKAAATAKEDKKSQNAKNEGENADSGDAKDKIKENGALHHNSGDSVVVEDSIHQVFEESSIDLYTPSSPMSPATYAKIETEPISPILMTGTSSSSVSSPNMTGQEQQKQQDGAALVSPSTDNLQNKLECVQVSAV